MALPLLALALIGLIAFLLLANTLPLKGLLSSLFPKFASHAALDNQLEAEGSTLTPPAVLGTDSNASGGQYIQFGTLNPPSQAFQPSAPYYVTFYYPWYKNPATDGSYSYWSDPHIDPGSPPNTWFSYYLPDSNPAVFDPASELYSSNDYNTFKWQVSKMAEAKLEVSISSWWGQGRKEDTAFRKVLTDFMGRADNPYPNLRWTVYYEPESQGDPTVSTLVSDMTYIRDNYATSPYYFKINNKPVLFVYAGSADIPGTMLTRWNDANTQLGSPFYLVLKVFPGFATASPQPDSWHEYAPANRSGAQGPYSFVSPGFWLDNTGQAERLVRDSNAFENAVKSMVSSNATWKLIETWNEWGEGSGVEPAEKVRYNVSTGKDEPDTSVSASYAFHNLYIDILNRNLPALEQGTGVNPSPSASAGDPVIGAAGDIVCGAGSTGAACKQMATSDLLLNMNPAAVLPLGDIQYEEGSLADFNTFYEPSWGRLKSVTHPAVGNHEYLTAGASGYFDYFNGVGNQTGPAGDRSKGYYAFDVGSWRLYALNSNCSQAGGCGAGSPQETWLRADLQANPRTCVLAYYHHPLHTSGSRFSTSVAPLFQALYDNGADVILDGHEHNYERFAPQDVNANPDPARGIREFVVGTGGRNFTQFVTTAANSEVKNDSTFGVLKLTLHPSSYDFQFVPVPGSSFTDSGTGQCH